MRSVCNKSLDVFWIINTNRDIIARNYGLYCFKQMFFQLRQSSDRATVVKLIWKLFTREAQGGVLFN